MRRTTTILLAATLALAGCSSSDSSDSDKPKPATTSAAETPTVDAAAQRTACVDAWAEAIDAGQEDIDQPPTACKGLPDADRLDRYMEGMQQRNQANRDEITDCVDDPTCSSVPIP